MWLIIDTETTGLDVKKDRVIELGAVVYDPHSHVMMSCQSNLVYEAGVNVSPEIEEITGINLTMLTKSAWTYNQLCNSLDDLMAKKDITHIVAHNATQFDLPILQSEFGRRNRVMMTLPIIDTYVDVPWPNSMKNKSLKYLCADHGFLNPWSHRALPDCLALMHIISKYDYKKIEARAASPTVILEALVSYEDKDRAKMAGFQWNPSHKQWTKTLKQIEYEEIKDKLSFPIQQLMSSV